MSEDGNTSPEGQQRAARSAPTNAQPGGAADGLAAGVQPLFIAEPVGQSAAGGGSPEPPPEYQASLLQDPGISGRGNAPVRAAVMRQVQRSYGNRALQRFLQHPPVVQRANGQQAVSAPQAVPARYQVTETVLGGGMVEIRVWGTVGDPIARPGLEKKYPLPQDVGLNNYDRWHLAGPDAVGAEAGVVYAPKNFNVSKTAQIENVVRKARMAVREQGGEVYFDFRARCRVVGEHEGVQIRVLEDVTWKADVRAAGSDRILPVLNETASATPAAMPPGGGPVTTPHGGGASTSGAIEPAGQAGAGGAVATPHGGGAPAGGALETPGQAGAGGEVPAPHGGAASTSGALPAPGTAGGGGAGSTSATLGHPSAAASTGPAPGPSPGGSGKQAPTGATPNALAAETAQTMRTDLRLMRLAQLVQVASAAYAAVTTLMDAAESISMAMSGASGRGFVHTALIAATDRLEAQSEKLDTDYTAFSASLAEMQPALFKALTAPTPPWRAGMDLWNMHQRLRHLDEDLAGRLAQLEDLERAVAARITWATGFLERPAAVTGIIVLAENTGFVAKIVGAREDLYRIRGATDRAITHFRNVRNTLQADLDFTLSWSTRFGQVAAEGRAAPGQGAPQP